VGAGKALSDRPRRLALEPGKLRHKNRACQNNKTRTTYHALPVDGPRDRELQGGSNFRKLSSMAREQGTA